MRPIYTAMLALASCLCAQPAAAADLSADPRLAWSVSFGGSNGVTAPALLLALDVARSQLEPSRTLVQLDLAAVGGSLRVAGLPLWQRDYRLGQNEPPGPSDPAAETAPVSKPWYARSWVLWTAGAIAGTAVLAGSGGASASYDSSHSNNQVNSGNGCTGVSGGNAGSTELPSACAPRGTAACANGICVFCDGSIVSSCGGHWADRIIGADLFGEIDRDRWFDAASGGMGDLIAR